jgi:archaellum component FlaC
MDIDERIEALVMTVELLAGEMETLRSSVDTLKTIAQQDGENIRALARIAEMHERRITDLEGGEVE